nr:hypothetical protein [Tanacetum cinerariifolium]
LPTLLSFTYHLYSLIMTSLFAESHNMAAILEKSDAAQGFEQIIDFLSGSYIHHALTVNPEFWNTAVVKRSGDVRLQALVNKKRIVIFEEVVREILQLNDAKGVICLPNDEIFAGLAHMGYEKPSTKLTFYKAFFSTQWKVGKGFLGVETPLFENMLAVRAVDVEEEVQVLDKCSALVLRVEGLENANA